MMQPAYTLFDSAIGRCAIAWNGRGIVALQLPEGSEAATVARICRHRAPGAVPLAPVPAVRGVIAAIDRLLRGGGGSLADVVLDETCLSAFHRRVYAAARCILPGETLTYGELARRLGEPRAARAVGQAMARNPYPIIVPCHRVMAARGRAGGFSGYGGVDTKLRLLRLERAVRAA
jgi:methylated-DNA-[protein]-cysteine S-methyltransferase